MLDPLGMLIDMLNGLITSAIDALIKGFVEAFNYLNAQGQNIMNFPILKSGMDYVQLLAIYWLMVKLVFEGYQTYMLRQAGDPDSNPTELLIKGAQSVIIIEGLPWIISQLYEFGNMVARDVARLNGTTIDVSTIMNGYKGLGDKLAGAGVAVLDIIIITLIFCVGIIMLFIVNIQIALRSAELAILTIIGPIMALNITTNNRSLWSQWFRQVLGLCLTHALQTFMLMVTMSLLSSLGPLGFSNLMLFIGWLWVTIKTPNFIKQFTHSTGAGALAGGAVKQAATMRVMRNFMGAR